MSRQSELAELSRVYDSSALSNRNIVINGSQTIDQRNSGSAITMSGSHQFATDRFICRLVTSSSSTFQRVADAPAGFYNSMKVTIGTGATPSSGDGGNYFSYIAEGQDTSHFNWGGSNAKTITLSFWVKCSIAGAFSIMIGNNALNRGYPASYTINSTNTWEYKTITVAGDTSGTWPTDNTGGVRIIWDWGNGSNFKGSAGAWAGADLRGGATGGTALCATTGATWQITGVQLELGDTATPFEHRLDELSRCQRYYNQVQKGIWGVASAAGNPVFHFYPPTEMRAAPSYSLTVNKVSMGDMITQGFDLTGAVINAGTHNTGKAMSFNFTASSFSATMTNYRPLLLESGGSFNGEVQMSAEL